MTGALALPAMASEFPAYSVRPHLLHLPHEKIVCPKRLSEKRHLLQTNWAKLLKGEEELDLLRCEHRPSAGAPECGARVIVLSLVGGWNYVVEISPRDIRELERMPERHAIAYLVKGTPIPTSESAS